MKRQVLALCTAAVCLLSGCSSLLERSYSTTEEHSSKYWESESADTLRAESYQDIVNDLLLLVGRHTEDAAIRLYNYEDDVAVAGALEQAAAEVQQETPMGAYAVEYITSESQRQRSYYEITVHLSYRRTLEQIQAVVNATSTSALPDLLSAAYESGKTELAVRIGYWDDDSAARVEQIVRDVRVEYGLEVEPEQPETEPTPEAEPDAETAAIASPWQVNYYPATGDVGLVEFLLTE